MIDSSNGYEGVAAEFLAGRGGGAGIGVNAVRKWARTLPRGAPVIDLGCGSGLPITEILVVEGLNVFVIDAAPSFVEAFRRNFPQTPVACEIGAGFEIFLTGNSMRFWHGDSSSGFPPKTSAA